MRYQTFYDLMDYYQDQDGLDLAENTPVRADKVAARTTARLGPRAMAGGPAKKRRPVGRLLRTGLVAAALVAALSVTAYAVYMATVDKYILPEPTVEQAPPPAVEEQTQAPAPTEPAYARLSMVGYQGTPEYEAYVEWETWQEENPPDFSSVGNDDSYYETDKNYATLYGAVFQSQAEKLDEIMAKYGLTPLRELHFVYAPEEVYDYLGTDPFLPAGSQGSGYVYDDGTFKLEAIDFGTEDLDGTLFVSVKGSFARISGPAPTDYEEWSYTAASGQTVDLVMGTDRSVMLFETDGAYIQLDVDMGTEAIYPEAPDIMSEEEYWASLYERLPEEMWDQIDENSYKFYLTNFDDYDPDTPIQPAYTKADLEKLADSVGFDVLAARFADPVDREKSLADYEAFVQRLENATDTYHRVGDADAAIAALGDYYLADVPEGYAMYIVNGQLADDPNIWDGYNSVTRRYQGPTGGEIILRWSDDPTLSELFPIVETEGGESIYPDQEQVQVNGVQARLLSWDGGTELEWFDESLGLRFLVTAGADMSQDQMISLAESVTAR